MMNPKSVHDKVASLEDRVRLLESERQEMIKELKKVVPIDKIETALRNAGETGDE